MIAALCFDPLPIHLAVRDDPELARVPLVSADEQRVTHANAAARRHGITPGMRLDGARMRVEGLAVVGYAEPDLQHAWEDILRELNQHTPWVEDVSRGRAFMKVDAAEAEEIATRYGVRAGLSQDRETAELAAVSSHPGSVRRVDEPDGFLSRLPLRFLLRVGLSEANLTRLTWLGLSTVAHLAGWTASQVTSYLAEEGEALLPYLHGPRHTELRPFELPPTVARSLAFTDPVSEPQRLMPAIDRLAGELAKELGGRGARRLTLTAMLPSGTRRASRLSKRPLTQARHIRQQALFALEDSHVRGQAIERLTVELASPEQLGTQEGLWPQRERRQRALEATMERFPSAPRRLAWMDPHTQATELVGRWESYAEDGGAYDKASVAERGSRQFASEKRRATRHGRQQEAERPAAVMAAAVPLFQEEVGLGQVPLQPAATSASSSTTNEPAAIRPHGTTAAASYLDALFTGTAHAEDASERHTGRGAKARQRYTEEYGLEAA